MSDCDEIIELLSARLDGELTAEEESILARHLAECPQCRDLANDFSAIHAALPDMNEVPPPGIKEAVMARIEAQVGAPLPFPQKRTPARRWQGWGAAAAIFLLVAAGAFGLEYGAGRGGNGSTMGSQYSSAKPSVAAMPSPSASPAPSPGAAPEAALSDESPDEGAGDAQPQQKDNMRANERTTAAPQAPEAPPQAPAGLQPFTAMTAQPPSPEDAARRLCDEVLDAEVQDGTWTEENETLTGCLLPGGGWSIAYLGLSEDGAAYEFRAYVGDEEGRVYSVPLDGGEIRLLEQEE